MNQAPGTSSFVENWRKYISNLQNRGPSESSNRFPRSVSMAPVNPVKITPNTTTAKASISPLEEEDEIARSKLANTFHSKNASSIKEVQQERPPQPGKRYADLIVRIRALQFQMKDLDAKLEENSRKRQEGEQRISNLKSIKRSHDAKLKELEEREQRVLNFRKSIDQNVEEMEESVWKMTEQLHCIQETKDNYKNILDNHDQERENISKNFREFCKEHQQTMEDTAKKLDTKKAELNQLKTCLSERLNEMEKTENHLKMSHESQVINTTQKQQENDKLDYDLAASYKQIEELENRLKETELTMDKLQVKERRLSKCVVNRESEAADCEFLRSEFEEKNRSLKDEKEAFEMQIVSLERETKQIIQDKENVLIETRREIKKLKEKEREAKKRVTDAENEIEMTKQIQHEEIKRLQSEADQQIQEISDEIGRLEIEINDKGDVIAHSESEVVKLTEECEQIEREMEKISMLIEETEQENNQMSSEKQDLSSEYAKLIADNQDAETKYQILLEEIRDLEKCHEELKEQQEKLMKENDYIENDIESSRGVLKVLEQLHDIAIEERKQKETDMLTIRRIKQEIKMLKKDIANINGDIENTDRELQEMAETLKKDKMTICNEEEKLKSNLQKAEKYAALEKELKSVELEIKTQNTILTELTERCKAKEMLRISLEEKRLKKAELVKEIETLRKEEQDAKKADESENSSDEYSSLMSEFNDMQSKQNKILIDQKKEITEITNKIERIENIRRADAILAANKKATILNDVATKDCPPQKSVKKSEKIAPNATDSLKSQKTETTKELHREQQSVISELYKELSALDFSPKKTRGNSNNEDQVVSKTSSMISKKRDKSITNRPPIKQHISRKSKPQLAEIPPNYGKSGNTNLQKRPSHKSHNSRSKNPYSSPQHSEFQVDESGDSWKRKSLDKHGADCDAEIKKSRFEKRMPTLDDYASLYPSSTSNKTKYKDYIASSTPIIPPERMEHGNNGPKSFDTPNSSAISKRPRKFFKTSLSERHSATVGGNSSPVYGRVVGFLRNQRSDEKYFA